MGYLSLLSTEMAKTNQATGQVCPECGAEFRCGAVAGEATCWCFDLPNVIPLDQIGDDQQPAGCLCPECLQKRIKAVVENGGE